ncbi:MAG: glycosyltransferase family 4 protein [Actinomycetes bacterium]
MKVAYVTPRYGPQVMGGAEGAARSLAEHLVADLGHEAEVFTTCALDHLTWDDVLEPGTEMINGVTVHRFRSAAGRPPRFFEVDAALRASPSSATYDEALEWVTTNGPVTPDLLDALEASDADVVSFYPYLFYMTVHGISRVRQPAVLHPAAHDEPALYLKPYADAFAAADAFCYHTRAERHLVEHVMDVAETPQIVLGLGTNHAVGRGRPGGVVAGIGDRPYVVSVGRVDEQKGSVMLARFFTEFKKRNPGPLALVFVGPVSATIPDHPDLVVTGIVDEEDKWDLIGDALVSISPSAMESFSLVVLEAWVKGIPAMVNATCGPTVENCERSGGGLAFDSFASFEVTLQRLITDASLRRELGEKGRRYVAETFDWPVLIRRYEAFLLSVIERGRTMPDASSRLIAAQPS